MALGVAAEGPGAELVPGLWDGSPFASVVPHEMWTWPVAPKVAGAIHRRMEELASSGDPEEYRRAREELTASEWVGDIYKDRVLSRCDELRARRR